MVVSEKKMGWWEWIGLAASVATLAMLGHQDDRQHEVAVQRVETGSFRRVSLHEGLTFEEGTFESSVVREPSPGLGGELKDRAPERNARAGHPPARRAEAVGREDDAGALEPSKP